MEYKILIADDEAEIRSLLRLYLENEHYQVIEAEDGVQALELLKKEQPAPLCVRYYDAKIRRISCPAKAA